MKNRILIDADEFVYRACVAAEYDLDIDNLHYLMSDFGVAQRIFDEAIFAVQDRLDASDDTTTMALSSSTNFRKDVLVGYKANRKNNRKPLAYRRLCDYVTERFDYLILPSLEADDVLGIHAEQYEYLVSSDKDLLTVPGLHYNPQKDTVVGVMEADANWRWLTQTLTGDAVDGYKGCPKVGPVKAQTILGSAVETPGQILSDELPDAWAAVVGAFEAQLPLGEAAALAQARVARILRPGEVDEDCQPILWTP